ncbi:hypothetical protein BJ878DRAFT_575667 [Calycina marina]|uniref:Uncharacterized protein n=1 Tax=Calycina marina TaxID=1763456 RepID=A0A9P7Z346_9HELO|nr:hypothetical protein BJ878DRAFT_575667 [Calycina marina]
MFQKILCYYKSDCDVASRSDPCCRYSTLRDGMASRTTLAETFSRRSTRASWQRDIWRVKSSWEAFRPSFQPLVKYVTGTKLRGLFATRWNHITFEAAERFRRPKELESLTDDRSIDDCSTEVSMRVTLWPGQRLGYNPRCRALDSRLTLIGSLLIDGMDNATPQDGGKSQAYVRRSGRARNLDYCLDDGRDTRQQDQAMFGLQLAAVHMLRCAALQCNAMQSKAKAGWYTWVVYLPIDEDETWRPGMCHSLNCYYKAPHGLSEQVGGRQQRTTL